MSNSGVRVPPALPNPGRYISFDTTFIRDVPKFGVNSDFVNWLDKFESRCNLVGLKSPVLRPALILSLESEVFGVIKSLINPAKPQDISVIYSRLLDLLRARYHSSGGVHLASQRFLATKEAPGQD